MSPTRREQVRETRARILEAASRLTRERGPGGFSMDVLAKEAGVARATVYEHFRSKRALLDELTSSMSRSVRIEEGRNGSSDPAQGLHDLIGDVCRHWAEQEDRMRELRTLAAVIGAEEPRDAIEAKSLRRLVDGLDATGRLAPGWSPSDAVDALATLTSYPTYEQLRRAPRTPEQVENMLDRLVGAITQV
jgi:AcrR family transcriptional regulator